MLTSKRSMVRAHRQWATSEAHELTEAFSEAHQQRNHARLSTPLPLSSEQQSALEEQLARLRVHLSLLALGSVKQRDEPLRLAIQVERLNSGIHTERSKADELDEVLVALLALGPCPQLPARSQ